MEKLKIIFISINLAIKFICDFNSNLV